MQSSSRVTYKNKVEIEKAQPFALGLRELVFLFTILIIGFSGFNVCVDKISAAGNPNNITSITVYDAKMTSYYDKTAQIENNTKVN